MEKKEHCEREDAFATLVPVAGGAGLIVVLTRFQHVSTSRRKILASADQEFGGVGQGGLIDPS
jgi:hypothetical protein